MTLESFAAFVQSRTSSWMYLLPLLIGVGAWLSAGDERSLTLRTFLLTVLPLLPIGFSTSIARTPAIELERTLPVHLRLYEFAFVLIWSGMSILWVFVAFALPEQDTFITDRVVRGDWIGNILASVGLALAWMRFFPSRLAWIPSLVWISGALVGALPDMEIGGLLPTGFWWWPVASSADSDAQWTKLALFLGGSLLFLLPELRGRSWSRRGAGSRLEV